MAPLTSRSLLRLQSEQHAAAPNLTTSFVAQQVALRKRQRPSPRPLQISLEHKQSWGDLAGGSPIPRQMAGDEQGAEGKDETELFALFNEQEQLARDRDCHGKSKDGTLHAARRCHHTPQRRKREFLPSSDSSLIPFAKRNVVAARSSRSNYLEGDMLKAEQDPTEQGEASSERTCGEFPRRDGRTTADFRKRARYKPRNSNELLPKKSQKVKKNTRVEKKPGTRKARPVKSHSTNALLEGVSAKNVAKDRLTLHPSHRLGLFKKGRASSSVKKRGLPDLAFSEMNFLCGTPTVADEPKSSKHKKNGHETISSYFDCTRRRALVEIDENSKSQPSSFYSSSNRGSRLPRGIQHSSGPRSPTFLGSIGTCHMEASSVVFPTLIRNQGIFSLPGDGNTRAQEIGDDIQDTSLVECLDDISEYSRNGFQAKFKHNSGDQEKHTERTQSNSPKQHSEVLDSKEVILAKEAQPQSHQESHVENADPDGSLRDITQPDYKENCASVEARQAVLLAQTPRNLKHEKPLNSSSPLGALMRVCAESPIRDHPGFKRSYLSNEKERYASTSKNKDQFMNHDRQNIPRGLHHRYQDASQSSPDHGPYGSRLLEDREQVITAGTSQSWLARNFRYDTSQSLNTRSPAIQDGFTYIQNGPGPEIQSQRYLGATNLASNCFEGTEMFPDHRTTAGPGGVVHTYSRRCGGGGSSGGGDEELINRELIVMQNDADLSLVYQTAPGGDQKSAGGQQDYFEDQSNTFVEDSLFSLYSDYGEADDSFGFREIDATLDIIPGCNTDDQQTGFTGQRMCFGQSIGKTRDETQLSGDCYLDIADYDNYRTEPREKGKGGPIEYPELKRESFWRCHKLG